MCYFITVAVDEKYVALMKAKLRSSFNLSSTGNHAIVGSLRTGDAAFVLTDGACACGLYGPPRVPEDKEEKLRRKYARPKYKKRGWSEDKINRAIADGLRKPPGELSGLRADLRWQLCDLAAEAGRVSLVVHFYSGGTETEEIPLKGKKVVRCEELQDDNYSVEEDVLVEIIQ